MANDHTIKIDSVTSTAGLVGMPADQLLNSLTQEIKQGYTFCPACQARISLPPKIEETIKEMAARTGGITSRISFRVEHAGEVPEKFKTDGAGITGTVVTDQRVSPEAKAAIESELKKTAEKRNKNKP